MTKVDIDAEKEILKRLGPLTTITPETKNPEELLKYFADDAVLQPPNQPQVTGHDTFRKVFQHYIELPVVSISGGAIRTEVSASGDLAYDIGKYRVDMEGPDGPVVEEGNYFTIWKKIDGEWKLAGQSWSIYE
jgi:ketosteroid isomerase-like protein